MYDRGRFRRPVHAIIFMFASIDRCLRRFSVHRCLGASDKTQDTTITLTSDNISLFNLLNKSTYVSPISFFG